MVNLLTGQRGSGKTQQMIELANNKSKECNGSVVFIKKTHRDTASVAFKIRTVCLDDYPAFNSVDAYVGLLYGMYSSNHDIEYIFIDGILKLAGISLENMPELIDKMDQLSKMSGIEFYVSISADESQLAGVDKEKYTILS